MTLQTGIEVALAAGAVLLLARDLHRAWLDQLRRPITLLISALLAALLAGALGGRPHPSPWWLMLPAAILAWEVVRGWRRAPRSHLREAGAGAFAVSLVLGAAGLSIGRGAGAVALLAGAGCAAVVGAGLIWRARRQEPRPWRPGDSSHYERRSGARPEA